jgi:ABC-type multidrug transport system fused ATPase/permease subunit
VSGGQKQRIQIARAVYAAPDVVLLDDPLSALDAKVGRAVFRTCLMQELKGCTRVLVTNQLQYVSEADHVVVLKDGEVAESGNYKTLMAQGGVLADMLQDVTADDGADVPAGAPARCAMLSTRFAW